MTATVSPRILAADLDGTLHGGDIARLLLARLLAKRFWKAPQALAWLSRGRLQCKIKLAEQVSFDPARLDWNEQVLDFLRAESARPLVLATAAMQSQAEATADYLRRERKLVFEHVLASTEQQNLISHAKAAALSELAGEAGFDYIGDSPQQDPPVFAAATVCHFVNPTAQLLRNHRTEKSMVFTTSPKLEKAR